MKKHGLVGATASGRYVGTIWVFFSARLAHIAQTLNNRNTAKLAPNEKLTSDRESRGKRES